MELQYDRRRLYGSEIGFARKDTRGRLTMSKTNASTSLIPGDLVMIVPRAGEWSLEPGEPSHCVFLELAGADVLWEWGDQVAGECDCLVLWRGEVVPFRLDDLTHLAGV